MYPIDIDIDIDALPVVMSDDTGFELRMSDLGDGMIVNVVHMPAGADFTEAFSLLHEGRCQCPHYGYVISGAVYTTSAHGRTEYRAGQPFYWAPGHVPGAIEKFVYVDFAPAQPFAELLEGVSKAMVGPGS